MLIAPNDCVVDECSVAGQVFYDGNEIALPFFEEYQEMPVRYGRYVND